MKRNSQPTLLEDFAGLSYDMVTPSQPTPSAGTVVRGTILNKLCPLFNVFLL